MSTVASGQTAINYRKRLRDNGFVLLPCTEDKRPLFAFKRFTRLGGGELPTDAEIEAWEALYPGANQLMVTEGAAVGLVVIDSDDRAQAYAIEAAGQPRSPLTCETRQGDHYFYRRPAADARVVSRNGHLCAPDFSNVNFEYAIGDDGAIVWGSAGERFGHTKIDVKADGAYCVHAGSTRKDGLPYVLKFNGVPIDPAVAFDPAWLEANVPLFDIAAWETTCAALKLKRQEIAARARAERDSRFPSLRRGKAAWAARAAAGAPAGDVSGLTHEPVIAWAVQQPDQVNHACWRGVATNVAAVFGEAGRARFHTISGGYTVKGGYCAATTDRCYDDALASVESHGPTLYATLQELGYPGDVPSGFSAPAHFLRVHEEKRTADELFAFVLKDLVYVTSVDRVFSRSEKTLYHMQAVRHRYSRGGVAARWEAYMARDEATGVTFDPSGENVRHGYINTYDPRELMAPDDGDASEPPGFRAVVESLGQEAPGAADWLIKLIAWQFRNVGRGWTQCVLMHGASGVGKGLLAQYLKGLYGAYSYVARSTDVESQFNVWAKDKLMIFGEEILESNSQARSLSNKLKDMITGTDVSYEGKGVDQRTAPNHARWMLSSNLDKPLHIDVDDRRFTVLHQSTRMDYAVGKLAWEEATSRRGLQRLTNYLHTVDLTDFNPILVFNTDARTRLQLAGMNLQETYLHEAWRTGTFTSREVYEDFLGWCSYNNVPASTIARWANTVFVRSLPHNVIRGQRTTGDRAKTLTFPPLADGRRDPTPEHRSNSVVLPPFIPVVKA